MINRAKGAGHAARPLSFSHSSPGRPRPALRALAPFLAVLAGLLLPSFALADGAPGGRLIVPGDHVDPGQTITITGTRLTAGSEVILRLTNGSTVVELGRAVVDADSGLSTTATVPQGFPTGYAELTASDPDGSEWSTFLLIGDRPEGPGQVSGGGGLDDRLVWLVVLAAGLAILGWAAFRYLRPGAARSPRG